MKTSYSKIVQFLIFLTISPKIQFLETCHEPLCLWRQHGYWQDDVTIAAIVQELFEDTKQKRHSPCLNERNDQVSSKSTEKYSQKTRDLLGSFLAFQASFWWLKDLFWSPSRGIAVHVKVIILHKRHTKISVHKLGGSGRALFTAIQLHPLFVIFSKCLISFLREETWQT